jgi:hypothetical protein
MDIAMATMIDEKTHERDKGVTGQGAERRGRYGSVWISMKGRAAYQRKERKSIERDGQEMLVLGWV